jgi:hypothetical protein
MTDERIRVLMTDSETFSDLAELPVEDEELIFLRIGRNDIESGNMAHALDSLNVLVENAENVRRYQERLIFIVDGYDNDPRALPEIQEVRTYFNALVREWPYWLWFQARGFGAIGLLFSLLCKIKIIRPDDGESFGTEFVDIKQIGMVAMDLFDRSNPLFDAYGITEAEARASADSFANDMGG